MSLLVSTNPGPYCHLTFSSMEDKLVIAPDPDTGNNQIALTSEA